eukprot:Platyproteum_vivax@DN2403_c0_g1_i2.p1
MPMMGVKLAGTLVNWPFSLFPSRAKEFKYPVLVFHGKLDLLTDPDAACKFYELVSSADKTLKIFPDSYHEVHQDINREEMYTLVGDWILKRAPNARPFGLIDKDYLNPYQQQKKVRKAIWNGVRPFWDNLGLIMYMLVVVLLWRKYQQSKIKGIHSVVKDVKAILRCGLWPLEVVNAISKQMMQ